MTESFEKTVSELQQMITKSKRWAVVVHVHPDGDAIGSSLGFTNFLKSLGKEATVILPDPPPHNLSFLEGYDTLMIASENPEACKAEFLSADAIGFLDFNKPSRCGLIEDWIEASSATKVMIDHHPYPDFPAVLQISETSVSSTCELIARIIKHLDMMGHISESIASSLYTGILTDTGGFSHNSSKSELYRIVADLLDKGIDKDFIHNEVLHQQSASRMQLMGYCLSEKLTLIEDMKTAIISLDQDELARFNYQKGDTEGFVNLPLSIKGIVLSILVMNRDGDTRLSFRSKGDFPANKVASDYFNGGGHFNAAGGRSEESVVQTVVKLKAILPEYKEFL